MLQSSERWAGDGRYALPFPPRPDQVDAIATTKRKGARMPGRSSQTRKSTSYTSSNSPLPQSSFPGHHLLLDPRFLIQLTVLLLSVAGLYYGLVAKQDNLSKEQLRQGAVLEKIESRLPNSEALELRLRQIEGRVNDLNVAVKEFDSWVRITREERAAEKAAKRDGG